MGISYADMITRVRDEVLLQELAPDLGSEPATDAWMLRRVHAAVVAVAQGVPIERLAAGQITTELVEAETFSTARFTAFNLPDTLFAERSQDLGIASFVLDGSYVYQKRLSVTREQMTLVGGNRFQADQPFVHVYFPEKRVYVTGADTMAVQHVPTPVAPGIGDISSTDVVLAGNDAEQAVQLCAMHILGTRGNDAAMAALHGQMAAVLNGGGGGAQGTGQV